MKTSEANRIAVGGRTQAVCRALKGLGMKQCTARLVQYQFKPTETRLDWYGLFWRWFRALWVACRAGAEFLFEDFCARVAALRDADPGPAVSIPAQIERCEARHYEFVCALARGADDDALIRAGIEEIVERRELVRLLTARKCAGGAARRARQAVTQAA